MQLGHLAARGWDGLIAADIKAKNLPGEANQKVMDLAGMLLMLCTLGCICGFLIVGVKMAVSFRRGEEFSEMGKLPVVAAGCIIVGSASGIGTYFIPDSGIAALDVGQAVQTVSAFLSPLLGVLGA